MHIKLSGAYGLGDLHAGALARLWLAELGSGRLLWGSDWPCTNHEAHADCAARWGAGDGWRRDAGADQGGRVDKPQRLYRGEPAGLDRS